MTRMRINVEFLSTIDVNATVKNFKKMGIKAKFNGASDDGKLYNFSLVPMSPEGMTNLIEYLGYGLRIKTA